MVPLLHQSGATVGMEVKCERVQSTWESLNLEFQTSQFVFPSLHQTPRLSVYPVLSTHALDTAEI